MAKPKRNKRERYEDEFEDEVKDDLPSKLVYKPIKYKTLFKDNESLDAGFESWNFHHSFWFNITYIQ